MSANITAPRSCKPKEDVCVTHDEPLVCPHACATGVDWTGHLCIDLRVRPIDGTGVYHRPSGTGALPWIVCLRGKMLRTKAGVWRNFRTYAAAFRALEKAGAEHANGQGGSS
jgi:hypothetical protein